MTNIALIRTTRRGYVIVTGASFGYKSARTLEKEVKMPYQTAPYFEHTFSISYYELAGETTALHSAFSVYKGSLC